MVPDIRPYDEQRDLTALARLWREIGWIDDGEGDVVALRRFLGAGGAEVGLIGGEPECLVHRAPGLIRYDESDLPLTAITAVTTSTVGRKLGLATGLTARALAAAVAEGAAVAALGIFDQGFYDRLGFGSYAYTHRVTFDPAALNVDHVPYRRPVRITEDDHAEIHSLLQRRHRTHGGVSLDPPEIVAAELAWAEKPFGFGLRDDDRLTAVVYGKASGEYGPYIAQILAYESPEDLLSLLRVIHELGDQVESFRLTEPAEIQFQDLVATPLRTARRTAGSPHATGITADASFQLRILDLATVVAARSWTGGPVRFNLELHDPIATIDGTAWHGIGGSFVVELGPESAVEPGVDRSAPTVRASVNAFSRCWFAVRPASSLALTDDLAGPADLLKQLDRALALPRPAPGLDF